jgi:hypothetical protein
MKKDILPKSQFCMLDKSRGAKPIPLKQRTYDIQVLGEEIGNSCG